MRYKILVDVGPWRVSAAVAAEDYLLSAAPNIHRAWRRRILDYDYLLCLICVKERKTLC